MPVEAKVAAIFCPIRPDFPRPLTQIRPRQASIASAALTKSAPILPTCSRTASASIWRTRLAASRITVFYLSPRRRRRTRGISLRISVQVPCCVCLVRRKERLLSWKRSVLVGLAFAAAVGAPGVDAQSPAKPAGRCRPAALGSAEGRLRDLHAVQRPAGHPAPGPQAADRSRQSLVSRGLEERKAGTNGFCTPLRAHDVPGLPERLAGLLHLRRARRGEPGWRVASTARPTTTGRTTSSPSRRPASSSSSGSNRTGSRPWPTPSPRRSSTTSGTSSRTSGARASRTRPTGAGSSSSRRTSSRRATPIPGPSSAATRT